MEQHHKINLHDQRPPYFSVLKCPQYFLNQVALFHGWRMPKIVCGMKCYKKTYVSYLNNEISIHDFEYVVTTDIWWPLTK